MRVPRRRKQPERPLLGRKSAASDSFLPAASAEEQSVPKAILIVESWPIWNLSTMLQNTAKPVPI